MRRKQSHCRKISLTRYSQKENNRAKHTAFHCHRGTDTRYNRKQGEPENSIADTRQRRKQRHFQTFNNPPFTISPVNLAAIRRLEAAGIRFAIATGRTHYDTETICRKHALEPYIISNNGACVFRPDGTLLSGKALDKAFVSGRDAHLPAF